MVGLRWWYWSGKVFTDSTLEIHHLQLQQFSNVCDCELNSFRKMGVLGHLTRLRNRFKTRDDDLSKNVMACNLLTNICVESAKYRIRIINSSSDSFLRSSYNPERLFSLLILALGLRKDEKKNVVTASSWTQNCQFLRLKVNFSATAYEDEILYLYTLLSANNGVTFNVVRVKECKSSRFSFVCIFSVFEQFPKTEYHTWNRHAYTGLS